MLMMMTILMVMTVNRLCVLLISINYIICIYIISITFLIAIIIILVFVINYGLFFKFSFLGARLFHPSI